MVFSFLHIIDRLLIIYQSKQSYVQILNTNSDQYVWSFPSAGFDYFIQN